MRSILSMVAPVGCVALATLTGLSGCTFNEGLVIEDMTGTVVVPREAATRQMPGDADGETTTDVRLIGPVVLGFYPDVRDDIYSYPHPEVGPAFSQDVSGDAYPYGGTTVGDIRHPCVSDLRCRVTAGRFLSYDGILDWFKEKYQAPIVDAGGVEIATGEYIRQTCFERLFYTSDEEIRLVAEDENEDGQIDTNDLQFIENADGDFEAEFIVYQQEFFEGMHLWGWMDSPNEIDGSLETCNERGGFNDVQYDDTFSAGVQYQALLNFPDFYIQEGDYVAPTPGWEYTSVDDEVVIRLDVEVLE